MTKPRLFYSSTRAEAHQSTAVRAPRPSWQGAVLVGSTPILPRPTLFKRSKHLPPHDCCETVWPSLRVVGTRMRSRSAGSGSVLLSRKKQKKGQIKRNRKGLYQNDDIYTEPFDLMKSIRYTQLLFSRCDTKFTTALHTCRSYKSIFTVPT